MQRPKINILIFTFRISSRCSIAKQTNVSLLVKEIEEVIKTFLRIAEVQKRI